MSTIEVNKASFHRRLGKLVESWKKEDGSGPWSGIDGLLAVMGSPDEQDPYKKTAALHSWLLGYEFPATLMLITRERITIITSSGKAKFLDPLVQGCPIKLELVRRTKDDAENARQFSAIADQLKTIKNIGEFPKDEYSGKFMEEWKKATDNTRADLQTKDAGPAVSACLQVKEDDELRNMRAASKSSLRVLTASFVEQMSSIIDQERSVKQSSLAEKIERVIEDGKFTSKISSDPNFDPEQLEWCYTPIIQSGGVYDLKPSAETTNAPLSGDVIVCSLGLRYKSYCSNVGRTYLIDPTNQQKTVYNTLVGLQRMLIEKLKPGAIIKDVYDQVIDKCKADSPSLAGLLTRNFGCGIGIDFRDTSLAINGRNATKLEAGMVLNVAIGFHKVENAPKSSRKPETFSMQLIDTVKVGQENAEVLTDTPKSLQDIMYEFDDDEESDVERPAKKSGGAASAGRSLDPSAILSKKTRGAGQVKANESNEARRKEHQRELAMKLQDEGLRRFPDGSSASNGNQQAAFKKFESYKRESQLPPTVNSLRLVVDQRNQTVIVPVFGRPVPFHINTIKSVSKTEEGESVFLRINLISPGQVIGRKEDTPFENPNASFVRSLTFRSTDTDRMNEVNRQIAEMKKVATKREAERRELADVVEQGDLIEIKNRRPLKLLDVYVRPGFDGKRVTGELEIHQNGLRYQSPVRADHRIDILFSNVKHLFFQPCDHELLVLIHVHLKDPIMVAKRKTRDVQFYREASDVQFDETANRKRKIKYGDEDELEAEQEERRRRAQLNKEFKAFSEKIAEASDGRIDVDIPFRELGFNGVPFRSNVLLQPTTECLVHLTDAPFLVLTLSEVEIVHLERIQFGLKNFDMVFVLKDYNKPPIHINTVPMSSVDNVKEWLDSTDIVTSEGPLNLNWTTIMKTVNDDPHDFFKEGGWRFLSTDSDDEDGSNASESGSEYVMSSSGAEDEASEGSDFDDDDASDDSGSYEDEDDMSVVGDDDEEDEEDD
ncbi:FACT complex subunit spt16 [Savitreella phatthalungensis]